MGPTKSLTFSMGPKSCHGVLTLFFVGVGFGRIGSPVPACHQTAEIQTLILRVDLCDPNWGSNGKWTRIESMYFLLKNGDIPARYVSLPEGRVEFFLGPRFVT